MSFGSTSDGVLRKIIKNVLYRVIIISRAFCCVPLDNITSFVKKPKSKSNVSDRISNVISRYKSGDAKSKPTLNNPKEQISSTPQKRGSTRYLIYLPKRPKKNHKCFQIDPLSIDRHDKNFKMWSIREVNSLHKKGTKDLSNLVIDKSYITHDGKVIVKLKKKPFSLKRLFSSKPKVGVNHSMT